MSDVQTKPKYLLEDSGEVVLNQRDGKRIVLAHYDEEKKHLTYESKDYSVKYRGPIMATIGTDADGKTPSSRTVRSMSIKGEALDNITGIPPRPKMDKNLGDATPAIVEWYFEYKPKEAYVRYSVKLDKNGQPVRGNCQRKVEAYLDANDKGDRALVNRSGFQGASVAGTEEAGSVSRETYMEAYKNVIIASRATHMTFLKEEQVGYDGGDDDEFEGMEESE